MKNSNMKYSWTGKLKNTPYNILEFTHDMTTLEWEQKNPKMLAKATNPRGGQQTITKPQKPKPRERGMVGT